MEGLRRRRPAHAALALLAAWVLALAPTVSRALAWATLSLDPWAEICSREGPQNLASAAAASGHVQGAAAHLEHCGHCALSALPFMAPSPPATPLADAAHFASPVAPGPASAAATHWPAAPARAPPRAA